MYPYTSPRDDAEVFAFMAGVGSSRTETKYQPNMDPIPARQATFFYADMFTEDMKDPRMGELPVSTWYHLDDRYPSIQDWYHRFIQDFALPMGFAVQRELYYRDHYLLAEIADKLETAGIERRHAVGTALLYSHLWRQISKADNGVHIGKVEDFYHCAAVASLPGLTGLQRLDCVRRIIDLDELQTMMAQGAPYYLAAETFPQRLKI